MSEDGRVYSLERCDPFSYFDCIYYINLDEASSRREAFLARARALGIESRVVRFPAVRTPENHHIGCALSHREIVVTARSRGWRRILVLEDDVMLHMDTIPLLGRALMDIKRINWELLYFGGHRWGQAQSRIQLFSTVRTPPTITTTHAIAYNSSCFDRLVSEIPGADRIAEWIEQWGGIDQFLNRENFLKVVLEPMLAMQAELFYQKNGPDPSNFF